jgi:hypothetical protein
MTLEKVWAQLEQDLSWRQAEIRLLSNSRNALKTENDRDRFRRAQLVMLYAHAEGFCKVALLIYVKAINSKRIKRSLACDEVVASSLSELFHALEFGDKKGKVFHAPPPTDEKMLLLSRRRDFVREFESMMRGPLTLPDNAVNTEDNLNSIVIRKTLFRLGLSVHLMEGYEESLNELVNRRNNIAHGIDDAVVRSTDYDRLERAVFGAMDFVVLTIIEALEQEIYLKTEQFGGRRECLSIGEMG